MPNIGLYSPWAYLAMVLVAATVGKIVLTCSPHFRNLVMASRGRLAPLDGLRGMLAFGVFIHHFVVNRVFVAEAAWLPPRSALYAFLGRGCVGLFFMISGFLFWSRAIDGKISARRLFVSRFWRIMPLYWATALVVLVTALSISHFQLRSNTPSLIRELVIWASGGVLGVASFNNVGTGTINAAVTWSLQYEWWFYFTLPLMAVLARPRRFIILLCAYVALHCLVAIWVPRWRHDVPSVAGFIFGMAAAYLARMGRVQRLMCTQTMGTTTVVFLVVGLWWQEVSGQYIMSILLGAPLFLAVACGNTLFGLLTRSWALFLGHISYSIYLVHGLVLYYTVQVPFSGHAMRELVPSFYWAYGVIISALMVSVSALSYRLVESPFLGLASLRQRQRQQ